MVDLSASGDFEISSGDFEIVHSDFEIEWGDFEIRWWNEIWKLELKSRCDFKIKLW